MRAIPPLGPDPRAVFPTGGRDLRPRRRLTHERGLPFDPPFGGQPRGSSARFNKAISDFISHIRWKNTGKEPKSNGLRPLRRVFRSGNPGSAKLFRCEFRAPAVHSKHLSVSGAVSAGCAKGRSHVSRVFLIMIDGLCPRSVCSMRCACARSTSISPNRRSGPDRGLRQTCEAQGPWIFNRLERS